VVVLANTFVAAGEAQSQAVAFLVPLTVAFVAAAIWWRLYQSKRRRLRAKTLGELLTMTPTQFEQAVADLLHDIGYRDVRWVGAAGDLHVDIGAPIAVGSIVQPNAIARCPARRAWSEISHGRCARVPASTDEGTGAPNVGMTAGSPAPTVLARVGLLQGSTAALRPATSG
jgi:hypothetical protein